MLVALVASCDAAPHPPLPGAAALDTTAVSDPGCPGGQISERTGECRPWVLSRRDHDQVAGHSATLLADGRVLVVGGAHGAAAHDLFSSVFRYDPVAEEWSELPPLDEPVAGHTATLLADGSVLLVGGLRPESPSAAVLLFEPEREGWRSLPELATARAFHGAVRLPDGRVLVAGGQGASGEALDQVELFDPATESWQAAADMFEVRRRHTLTLLSDGRVLAVGGRPSPHRDDHAHAPPALDSAAVYDPASDRWRQVAPMSSDRGNHRAALLPDGRVLVVGGLWDPSRPAELFDPRDERWRSAGFLDIGRNEMTLSPLPDGRIAVVGGYTPARGACGDVDLYSPDRPAPFAAIGAARTARGRHRTVLLDDGRLLLLGGLWEGTDGATSLLELAAGGLVEYGPSGILQAPWPTTTSSPARPSRVDADSATVGEAGRLFVLDGDGPTDRIWRYHIGSADWTLLPPLPRPTETAALAVREDGDLVVTDGVATWLLSAASPRWRPGPGLEPAPAEPEQPVPALGTPRRSTTVLQLPDGRRLAVGGTVAGLEPTRAVEVLDPGASSWRYVESLVDERADHSATLLADGRVLVAGGRNKTGRVATWVSWDPSSETWSTAHPLTSGRAGHAAFALPDGRVLLVGGDSDDDRLIEIVVP